MVSILVEHQSGFQPLTLYNNVLLSFELNNTAYFGGNSDIMQNSFMFSVSVPLESRNRMLLNHPNRLDNADSFVSQLSCIIRVQGIDVFKGYCSVRNAKIQPFSASVDIEITISTPATLKENTLKSAMSGLQYPLYDDSAQGIASTMSLLTATARAPKDYDFVCFPLHNPTFYESSAEGGEASDFFAQRCFQNYFLRENGQPRLAMVGKSAVTPFLKLSVILQALAKSSGFSLQNRFQTTHELQNIVLYNNYSIARWDESGTFFAFDPAIRYENHVPNIVSSEYLKLICRLFNLSVYTDMWDNTMRIVPSESVLYASAEDWTHLTIGNVSVEKDTQYPTTLGYAQGGETPPIFYTYPATPTSPKGVYQDPNGIQYYHNPFSDAQAEKIRYVSPTITTDKNNNNAFTSTIQAPTNALAHIGGVSGGLTPMPMLRCGGSFRLENANGTAETTNEPKNALLLYRGVVGGFPLALNESETVNNTPIVGDYALTFGGEKGIFNRFWARWYDMLKNKRIVKVQIYLSMRQVRNFSFERPVRLLNRNFIVKRITVKITQNAIAPCDVELIPI